MNQDTVFHVVHRKLSLYNSKVKQTFVHTTVETNDAMNLSLPRSRAGQSIEDSSGLFDFKHITMPECSVP